MFPPEFNQTILYFSFREKIEDEMKTENYSDTIRAPACEPVRFRANIITSERMRK